MGFGGLAKRVLPSKHIIIIIIVKAGSHTPCLPTRFPFANWLLWVTIHINHINVFSIVTGMFYFSYYYYKLNVIIICMVSSFTTGMFLFIHFVLMQQHGYALHSKIMHFIRGSYLGSYHGMYACFTSHGTYSLTT